MTDFQDLVAAAPEPGIAALRLEKLREDAALRKEVDALPEPVAADFINIIGYSTFLFNQICRNPQHIRLLGAPCEITPEQLAGLSDHEALRRFKYEHLLKITWMDVSGRYPYETVLEQLSLLADVIADKSFQLCFVAENGTDPAGFASVFALGKLGASELNYSSDIDLIFTCIDSENTRMKSQEMHKLLMHRLRRFTRSLEEPTATGFLYRVDLNLRPWGKSGPLFLSVDETENYYQASPEAWERLAWLRARCIAGNRELGRELLARMRPFIFMRSLSADDLKRFVSLKEEMARLRERSDQWHVKLGRGGIRDIEFFIQILQLVSAAKHAELQTTNTLNVLESLCRLNFISREDEREIRTAYLFLRRLENRLQMAHEKQVHALSDDEESRVVIARSLRIEGRSNDEILANFDRLLSAHRAIAEKYFEKVLPDTGAAPAGADKKGPISFAGAWNEVQAKISFNRWTELCEKQQWGELPGNKNLLINIFGASWYFTRYIFFRGIEIAELIDHYRDREISPEALDRSLQLDPSERDLDTLSRLKNEWMLLLLIRFLQGEIPLRQLEKELTLLAEAIFTALLGHKADTHPQLSGNVAVLAMGRMAGYEMIFGSDLDLIFLYRSKSTGDTSKIAQQLRGLLRSLSAISPSGLLYEVDMRLRPHGTAGSLITPVASFVDYHRSERAIWERQMMTRCRPIYDPENLGAEAMRMISDSIYADYDPQTLQDEIVDMRQLIENTLGSPRNKHEIKRGKGGIMDIDFITHFLQLRHGKDHEELHTASTRKALGRLAELTYIDAEVEEFLLMAYNYLKWMEICMRLIDLKASSIISSDPGQNAVLSRGMGFADNETKRFMEEFFAITERVREIFNQLLGKPE